MAISPAFLEPAAVCYGASMFSAFRSRCSGTHALAFVAIAFFCGAAGLASADGLLPVPATVTNELGAYYLTRLAADGQGFVFYSTLIGRNVRGSNAYAQVNGISSESPKDAAKKTSLVRGVYSENTMGGSTVVEVFFKPLRCEEDTCYKLSRVVALKSPDSLDSQDAVLGYLRLGVGATQWLVNADQVTVNNYLRETATENEYYDSTYQSQLFYKVSVPRAPCSSAAPRTSVGAVAEFEGLPQLACLSYQGVQFMAGVNDRSYYLSLLQAYAVPAAQCDGSVALFYILNGEATGPWIIVRRSQPEAVPLSVLMYLPTDALPECFPLYDSTIATLQATVLLARMDFGPVTRSGQILLDSVPASIQALGFNGTCSPSYFGSTNFVFNADDVEGIKSEPSSDPDFIGKLVPYNGTGACSCVLGRDKAGPLLTTAFDTTCAQLYYGDSGQQREAVVTFGHLDAENPPPDNLTTWAEILSTECAAGNHLTIRSILPQIAIDFETDKAALLSATEVKLHLDSVTANAASILAVEVALCASGVGNIVAQFVARFEFYRHGHLPQLAAGAFSAVGTGLLITLFNAPNLALVARSLRNFDAVREYTQTSVRQYKPSNYSAVLMAETHAFVTVRGSRATAFVGLGLYALTLLFCVGTAVAEFRQIARRRSDATNRLGRKALTADRHLLVEWRGTDALLFDTLQLRIDRATGISAPSTAMHGVKQVKSQASLPDSDTSSGTDPLWRGSSQEIEMQGGGEAQPEDYPGIAGFDSSSRRMPPRFTRFARMNGLTQ
ncbi:hypothetical protein KFL_004970090 [Klebsormidium nitens]|uniref:Uncharacterized protein n=1 Tax=Klebsormidium nitens TaxID=105231 RepID=A0A1Y1IGM6_KLENI|nr:hypothetical protein KFL_004970090 [Klebsormidium nitens]|eukprot:GAQ89212.1 hypothetical protein KFL_004970090 [Klebsormidium nitens]